MVHPYNEANHYPTVTLIIRVQSRVETWGFYNWSFELFDLQFRFLLKLHQCKLTHLILGISSYFFSMFVLWVMMQTILFYLYCRLYIALDR